MPGPGAERSRMVTSRLPAAAPAVASVSAAAISAYAEAAPLPTCSTPAFSFTPGVRMGDGLDYEPGLEFDSTGVLGTTAHKNSLVREVRTRFSSFLYRSTDQGQAFQDVPDIVPGAHVAPSMDGSRYCGHTVL